jgi:hypothetical protein
MRLLADENLDNDILRGLLRRSPDVDVVRVQDVGLSGADDGTVLEWAAREQRLLVTHDARTMIALATGRVSSGRAMPGVIEVSRRLSVGAAIEDLLLLVECSHPGEWEGRVLFLPL